MKHSRGFRKDSDIYIRNPAANLETDLEEVFPGSYEAEDVDYRELLERLEGRFNLQDLPEYENLEEVRIKHLVQVGGSYCEQRLFIEVDIEEEPDLIERYLERPVKDKLEEIGDNYLSDRIDHWDFLKQNHLIQDRTETYVSQRNISYHELKRTIDFYLREDTSFTTYTKNTE